MGSLFMVVVPIRDVEAALRQKEFNIKILESSSVERDEISSLNSGGPGGLVSNDHKIHHIPKHTDGSIDSETLGSGRRGSLSRGSHHSFTMSSITGSGTGSDAVDVYEATAGGKQVRVVVSDDSMAIVNVGENPDFGEPGRKKKISLKGDGWEDMDSRFLEKHLEDTLTKFDIMSACWGQSVDGNYSQLAFTVAADKSEKIINHMQSVGIGKKYSSSLCVCAASVYDEPELAKRKITAESDALDAEAVVKKTKWNDFVASIKSRLTVAQVVQSVKANAIMTFDYIVLIVVAGMIAGLGLIDDSSVNVVASMLVSPLMGPIMATTFGSVIRDGGLIKVGLTSELVGLAICLFAGYIFGICLQVNVVEGPWAKVAKWPTDQMRGRSELRSLAVGVMVAIPSGAGVALSILAGNSGSLVGVAISASLLPPAVNCGILWGLASVIAVKEKMEGRDPMVPCSTCLSKHNYTTNYDQIYCANTVKEYSIMGIVSFGLTMINIVVIFLVGIIILKIKEVAPHTTRKGLNRFWKTDLKVAREFGATSVSGLMDYIDETGERDSIVKKMEADAVFNTVNRRTGLTGSGNILVDMQRRKAGLEPSGSSEDIVPLSHQPQEHGGGWLPNPLKWFSGSKPQSVPASAVQSAHVPITVEDTKTKRPKLQ